MKDDDFKQIALDWTTKTLQEGLSQTTNVSSTTSNSQKKKRRKPKQKISTSRVNSIESQSRSSGSSNSTRKKRAKKKQRLDGIYNN